MAGDHYISCSVFMHVPSALFLMLYVTRRALVSPLVVFIGMRSLLWDCYEHKTYDGLPSHDDVFLVASSRLLIQSRLIHSLHPCLGVVVLCPRVLA